MFFFLAEVKKARNYEQRTNGILMFAADEYMQHTHACECVCVCVCVCVCDMRFWVGPKLTQNVNLCTLLGFHGFFM
jgi:hypothetical protein